MHVTQSKSLVLYQELGWYRDMTSSLYGMEFFCLREKFSEHTSKITKWVSPSKKGEEYERKITKHQR